jgi:phage gpG-like protein
MTLIDTKHLMKTITKKISGNTVRIGTNVKYAAIHQFGGKIERNITFLTYFKRLWHGKKTNSRHVKITIPARPFILLQAEDIPIIRRIISDHIDGKGKGAENG